MRFAVALPDVSDIFMHPSHLTRLFLALTLSASALMLSAGCKSSTATGDKPRKRYIYIRETGSRMPRRVEVDENGVPVDRRYRENVEVMGAENLRELQQRGAANNGRGGN